jgi:hypothetical protein
MQLPEGGLLYLRVHFSQMVDPLFQTTFSDLAIRGAEAPLLLLASNFFDTVVATIDGMAIQANEAWHLHIKVP